MNVGDLICFEWHASFFDPNKTLGKDFGTDHIPVGLIVGIEPAIEYRAGHFTSAVVVGTPTAKIVWQRMPGKSAYWAEYHIDVATKILRVIG
tara:strand:+ start:995 stop:1270 length:276 start_codon:yes stop_codon:yes gene_type:complete